MRPLHGEVVHFSEDPTITRFSPRNGLVWAVGPDRCIDYWFPRQCPRAMAWIGPRTSAWDAECLLGLGVARVHAIEYAWLPAMQSVSLYGYRLPAAAFDARPEAVTSVSPVDPLGPPEPVGDLLALHEAEGVQTRLVPNLWPWWDLVIASTLEFSGIRLRNARPRPA
jgi:Family of unknown function (DUF6886)